MKYLLFLAALLLSGDHACAQVQIGCIVPGTNVVAPCSSTNPLSVTPQASASGGGTASHTLSAANDNATQLITGNHTVYSVVLTNTTSTEYFLKLYDTATMTSGQCGSQPVLMTFPAPASSNPQRFESAIGVQVQNGIGFCLTANLVDTDDNSAATGVAIDIVYK
jgi:hypothetical protein